MDWRSSSWREDVASGVLCLEGPAIGDTETYLEVVELDLAFVVEGCADRNLAAVCLVDLDFEVGDNV